MTQPTPEELEADRVTFNQSLEEASREFAKWPRWKQRIILAFGGDESMIHDPIEETEMSKTTIDKIVPGDVVEVKSGGSWMTVTCVHPEEGENLEHATCIWQRDDGQSDQHKFPLVALRVVSPVVLSVSRTQKCDAEYAVENQTDDAPSESCGQELREGVTEA